MNNFFEKPQESLELHILRNKIKSFLDEKGSELHPDINSIIDSLIKDINIGDIVMYLILTTDSLYKSNKGFLERGAGPAIQISADTPEGKEFLKNFSQLQKQNKK